MLHGVEDSVVSYSLHFGQIWVTVLVTVASYRLFSDEG